jgi:long-chain acyl-CoA synthetase
MEANLSLYQAVKQTANKFPDNNALLFMGKYVTYTELIEKINQLAAGINELGIKKNDVITMALPNVFEAIYSFYAVNKLGIIAHMVHPVTPVKQMLKFMETTKSKILIILDTFYENYEPLLKEGVKLYLVTPVDSFGFVKKIGYKLLNRKRLKNIEYTDNVLPFNDLYLEKTVSEIDKDPMETATYLHSGGTSGEPKTIELSSFAINYLANTTSYIMDRDDFKNKHMLAVLPMFHGFGLCMGVHAMLKFGGVDTLMPKFNPQETIKLIKKNQVNYVIGVPSLFEALLRQPEVSNPLVCNLEQAFVGGDYVAQDLKKRFNQAMDKVNSKARLLEGYGLTEVVTVCSVNTIKHQKYNTVGKPLPGIDISIVDVETKEFLKENQDGIIAVSGPTMMNGYLNDEQATKETIILRDNKKWVLTGDYGNIDEEGYVHFKQRLKRIIKVSGMPVLPAEIENLLMNQEYISEVAAIGAPDKDKGFVVKLFVVWESNTNPVNFDEIKQLIKENLGSYAVPREIIILDELPKTTIGKTNVIELEKM